MNKFYIVFALIAIAVDIDAAKRCYPVPETQSPTLTCGENEDYHQCSILCGEKTCAKRIDRYCGLGCQERCLCKEGYIRDENKRCIKVEECPVVDPPVPICSKNHEEYNECGTACPLTCDSSPTQICTMQCVPGCFCETGYVRDKNGECILQAECPKPVCPRNEVYSECGAHGCQDTCDNPTKSYVCKAMCTPGCICEEGYIRDANGKCVLPRQCPTVCKKKYEVYTRCGAHKGCQKTCEKPNGGICPKICLEGCVCEDGYVRDADNDCILQEHCAKTECGKNQHYDKCASSCGPTTCDMYNGYVACRPIPGCFPTCICDEGYYLLDGTKECVLAENCPKRME